jgi:hypothetical protein
MYMRNKSSDKNTIKLHTRIALVNAMPSSLLWQNAMKSTHSFKIFTILIYSSIVHQNTKIDVLYFSDCRLLVRTTSVRFVITIIF